MLRFPIAALTALLVSQSALAYPIFIGCNADGTLRETLDTNELQAAVLGASDGTGMDQKFIDLCQGQKDCFAILKQAFALTQVSMQSANQLFKAELAKIAALADELNQSIDPSLSTTGKNIMSMAHEIYACRKSQEDPGGKKFVYLKDRSDPDSGLDVFITHRVDNEYLFVTGLGKTDDKNHRTDFEAMRRVIWEAVTAGVDPYAALAVSYLEEGKVKPFQLDPAAMMEFMGCPLTRVKSVDDNDEAAVAKVEAELAAQGKSFVYSWGTFYTMKPSTKRNAAVWKVMSEHGDTLDPGASANPKTSLACAHPDGGFIAQPNGRIIWDQRDEGSTASVSNSCCLEVPYASDTVYSVVANQFLKKKISGTGKPEDALQAFNGKGTIGLTEKKSVGAFRLGLNMATQPQYGYQGMDFILNSFMSNPAIRAEIADAEEATGNKPKSFICNGRGAGTFAVDSDYYLKKQKSSVRFVALIGRDWNTLDTKQRGMLKYEWDLMIRDKAVPNPKRTDAENSDYESKVTAFERLKSDAEKWAYYQSKLYPYRKTLYQTSMRSWKRLSDSDIANMRAKILAAPEQSE